MPLGEGFTAEEQVSGEATHGGIQIICYPLKRELYQLSEGYGEKEYCKIRQDKMEMGLGLGGKMKQEIYKDKRGLDAWDTSNSSRCFIHIANSKQYFSITNANPPTKPPSVEQYNAVGLSWFDYYDEAQTAQIGSEVLGGLQSINKATESKTKDNGPEPTPIVITPEIKKKVRIGNF